MNYSIYQLIDPRNNTPRYVGYTYRPLENRLQEHLKQPVSRTQARWFNELAQLGLQPTIHILEEINGTAQEAEEREAYWIQHLIVKEEIALVNIRSNTKRSERIKHTLYLPPNLSKWLKIHAASTEQDISDIAEEALQRFREETER